MPSYLDLRLRPDPEFLPHQLMDNLFAKLHRHLVEQAITDIGISFPKAGGTVLGLGHVMRLHSAEERLATLTAASWLAGMRELVAMGDLLRVPANSTPFAVRRMQSKSNPERIRRRQMKRKGWTAEQAKAAIPEACATRLRLPYLNVRSTSTGQNFRLFIRQTAVPKSAEGAFNSYGLSTTATLPMF